MEKEKAATGAIDATSFKDAEYYSALVRTRITQIRNEKNISMRDLSLSINKSHTYILDLSKKKTLPSMDSFLKICARLGVTPVEFFDESIQSPSEAKRIIFEMERLLDAKRIVLLRKVLEQIETEDVDVLEKILTIYLNTKADEKAATKRKKSPSDNSDG